MSSPPVVLDTNVLVAAGFKPRSASATIVDAVKQGQVRMVWNDATRREIEHIIGKIPPVRARADARAGGTTLISNDEHLLAHQDRIAVPVLTPGAFWRCLQRSSESHRTP